MTKDELVKLLVLTEKVYPRFLFKDETIQQWFKFCDQMDFEKVMAKLKNHIRRSPFPPAITDIAVFTDEDSEFSSMFQEWVMEGRERLEREYQHFNRTQLPSLLAEYSVRKRV